MLRNLIGAFTIGNIAERLKTLECVDKSL